MKFGLSSVLLSLAGLAVSTSALICSEALRFGNATVTPANPKEGDTLHILADFRCAAQHSGHAPLFVDYSLEVLPASNNGFESPIILGRHTLTPGALFDNLTATIPHALFAGAPYTLTITNTYSTIDDAGEPFMTSGGFEPIGPIVASS